MLKESRQKADIGVPDLLRHLDQVSFETTKALKLEPDVATYFKPYDFHELKTLKKQASSSSNHVFKVACLFSGGPAAGGHNVIAGLYAGLSEISPSSQLYGIENGWDGFLEGRLNLLTADHIAEVKNLGGFYLLGTSRKKMKTQVDFELAAAQVKKFGVNAIVVIGGDDSNTNALLLSSYFLKNGVDCSVIGIPKTIDGDLKQDYLEISFGFDTAAKVYSEIIGNIQDDARSACKYYHFIKIMGRSASHLTLECALSTQPNFTFISEEIQNSGRKFEEWIDDLAEMIVKRSLKKLNHGVVLIPEGLLEFIPEFNQLVGELGELNTSDEVETQGRLSKVSLDFYLSLPDSVRKQLFLERDPHGNIPLSQISTEVVVMDWVKKALSGKPNYRGKFQPVNHFLGYEGRCGFPTQFDCEYTYALGKFAAKMIDEKLTGYLAGMTGLKNPVKEWKPYAIPLPSMIHLVKDGEKTAPVIKKAYVDPSHPIFKKFQADRVKWMQGDFYISPGPIQFNELNDIRLRHLVLF